MLRNLALAVLSLISASVPAKTWQVGPTRQYTAPTKVMSLVGNGDTVEIDPGLYVKDVGAWNADSLVLRCSLGYAHLDAQGTAAQRKAIWVINGKRTYVEGIEFSGCAIDSADGQNGSGIRLQSKSLECRRCYFHDNQEGILTGNDTTTEILIEACEFDHNGVETGANAGFQHNIYIGHSRVATIKFCYFHRSIIGHEIKSRANTNYILYNHIVDGPDGDGSRSIDIPNGGLAFVIGNSIEKGPKTGNSNVIEYGLEGIVNPDSEFYFINNTVVANRHSIPILRPYDTTIFFNIQAGAKVTILNNIFAGSDSLNIPQDAAAVSNLIASDTAFFHFVDVMKYDYRIVSEFPGMFAAVDLSFRTAHGFLLQPTQAYRDPLDSVVIGPFPIDVGIGAFPTLPAGRRGVSSPSIELGSNFPNPFDRRTTIAVDVDIRSDVVLVVSDVVGNTVCRSHESVLEGLLTFDRGNLPAGFYHYAITSPGKSTRVRGSMVVK